MRLDVVSGSLFKTLASEGTQASSSQQTVEKAGSFSSYLSEALKEVDHLQKQASFNAEQLVLGNEDFLHNTVIAYEKASLALQLTLEIRNRMVEAYQEIMRMQM
ncbi:flagellar hook-basal body complex protein FliE [Syntrophomonas erecta]